MLRFQLADTPFDVATLRAQQLDDLLKKADFGLFDAALKELERPPGGPGGG